MKNWLRKSFVALITILTFGMINPYQTIQATSTHVDKPDNDDRFESNGTSNRNDEVFLDFSKEESEFERQEFVNQMIFLGEKEARKKFGNRIGPVIEDEFQQIILPNIEKAIEEVTAEFCEEELQNLVVSESPGKGKSEKIFHIYDYVTKKDIIRFHVRRELRPQEGYWFNFHYHTFHDDYQTHYNLGEIYWDTNTPPNWNSHIN